MTVLRQPRKTDCETKVLVLSARGEVADKVAGPDAGANDYLTCRSILTSLAARIRSLTLRRFTQNGTVLTCIAEPLIPRLASPRWATCPYPSRARKPAS